MIPTNNGKVVEDGAVEFRPSDVNYDPIRPEATVPKEVPEQVKMIDDLTRYLNELKSNYTGSAQDLVQLVTGKIKELELRDIEKERQAQEEMFEMLEQIKSMPLYIQMEAAGTSARRMEERNTRILLQMNSLFYPPEPAKKEEKGYFTRIRDRIKTYFK